MLILDAVCMLFARLETLGISTRVYSLENSRIDHKNNSHKEQNQKRKQKLN